MAREYRLFQLRIFAPILFYSTSEAFFGRLNCYKYSIFRKVAGWKHSQVQKFNTLVGDDLSIDRNISYFHIDSADDSIQFGDFRTISSNVKIDRTFVNVKDLGVSDTTPIGEFVWIRGRVHSVRAKGNACFLVMRSESFYTIQTCHFKDKLNVEVSKSLIKFMASVPLESIVDIYGKIVEADVKSCSQKTVEIQVRKCFVVARAPVPLPFLLEDAARFVDIALCNCYILPSVVVRPLCNPY